MCCDIITIFKYHILLSQTLRLAPPRDPLPRLRLQPVLHVSDPALANTREVQHQPPLTQVWHSGGQAEPRRVPVRTEASCLRRKWGYTCRGQYLEDSFDDGQEIVSDESFREILLENCELGSVFWNIRNRVGREPDLCRHVQLRFVFRARVWAYFLGGEAGGYSGGEAAGLWYQVVYIH